MLKSEALKNFLKVASSPLAKLYNEEMEVQVNVWKGEGSLKRDKDKDIFFVKEKDLWKPFRIPNDGEISFDLMEHAEGVGMTGWNFEKKQSHWVGFDFDSISNHKAGLNNEDLEKIISKANQIEYLSLYKSTRGKGLHIYIFFDKPIPTKDRAEHQALAQALLNFLSADSGFDFKSNVDCLGMVLWCWHRNQEGTNGLTLIKEGTFFPTEKIPTNWKNYINEKREVTKLSYGKELESLINSNQLKILTEGQQALLKWFARNGRKVWWYDSANKMLVAHTYDLKQAHTELNLKGQFETNSSGSSDQNCFCFPSKGDAWTVRRFGKHVREAPIWEIDELGWTKILYNAEPTLKQAALFRGGIPNSSGNFILDGNTLKMVLKDLNIEPIKEKVNQVEVSLKPSGLIIKTEEKIDGFLSTKHGSEKVLNYKELNKNENDIELFCLDDLIRHCIVGDIELGWFLNTHGNWVSQSPSNIPKALLYKFNDINSKSLQINQGMCIMNAWRVVCEPFKPEYPGNRVWNKNAPQFAFTCEQGSFDTWSQVLTHLSFELKPTENEWCKENGILTGHDYLLFWVASMFQRPEISLPYLFFWGSQNTGKSTLHDNLKTFFKNGVGYIRADHTLKSASGFNGELTNAVLCVIEETNLSTNAKAYNSLKDYITSQTLSIRALYCQTVLTPNYTHWIQCANPPEECPVMEGDTRIIALNVPPLEHEIPKGEFYRRLQKEAPAFLYKCLNLELPLPYSRVGLPVLETGSKALIQKTNSKEPVDMFIQEKCFLSWGDYVSWSDFCNRFDIWLSSAFSKERSQYTKHKTTLCLQKYQQFPKGKFGGYVCLGNLSFEKKSSKNFKLVEEGGILKKEEISVKDRMLEETFTKTKEI